MNAQFSQHLIEVTRLYAALKDMNAVSFTHNFPNVPGIYLFLENGVAERVGRSNNIRKRLKNHLRLDHGSGAYAFKRAREKLGKKATYRKGFGRKELQMEPEFRAQFRIEIERLKTLQVKFVEVEDVALQYLLEIYSAIELNLNLNEFGNH